MPTGVFAVFLDAYLHDDCRPLVEGLTCGRCFCYQDLPSQPWLWQAATASCIAGCVFRHMGESAQAISRYFGQTKVRKWTQTESTVEKENPVEAEKTEKVAWTEVFRRSVNRDCF